MLLKYCVFLFVILCFTEIVQARRSCILPEEPNYDLYDSIAERQCQRYLWNMKRRDVDNGCRPNFGVIGGVETDIGQYPHMGAVGWPSTSTDTWIFLCGSFLISDRFALTAAHCTKINRKDVTNKAPQIIRFGATNIESSANEVPMDIKICQIIKHPKYKSSKKYYDIALIKLKDKITFTKNIQPACLCNTPTIDTQGKDFTVTGWGHTEGRKSSATLMYANIDIFDPELCNKTLQRTRFWIGMSDHQLCAGKRDGSQDTCHGDSGGPLQYKLKETYTEGTIHRVVGITQFGYDCGIPDSPGVYIKVSSFIRWIEEYVWKTEYENEDECKFIV